MTTELLAQVLEVTSIMAARKVLKKEFKVPRPGHVNAAAARWDGPRGDRDAVRVPVVAHDGAAIGVRDPAYDHAIGVFRKTARVVR